MSKNGRRLALLIANNQYDDDNLPDLKSPVKDAKALKEILESDQCGNFEVTFLYDRSFDDAEDAIDLLSSEASQNDLLLFHYSGHGLRGPDDGLYFAFKNTRKETPDIRSVSASFLKRRLSREFCFSESVVTILDCCFSGLIADGVSKGGAGVYKSDFQVTGKGRYTLYAAGSGQEAKERDGQSVYTRHLIDALRFGGDLTTEPVLTVRRLQEYLRKEVKKERVGHLPDWTISSAENEIVLARNPEVVPPEADVFPPSPPTVPQDVSPPVRDRRFPTFAAFFVIASVGALVLWYQSLSEVDWHDLPPMEAIQNHVRIAFGEEMQGRPNASPIQSPWDRGRAATWVVVTAQSCEIPRLCADKKKEIFVGPDEFSEGSPSPDEALRVVCMRNENAEITFGAAGARKFSELISYQNVNKICEEELGSGFVWAEYYGDPTRAIDGYIDGENESSRVFEDREKVFSVNPLMENRYWFFRR